MKQKNYYNYVKNCYNVGLCRAAQVNAGVLGINGWGNSNGAVPVYNSFCDSSKFAYSHVYWNGIGYSLSYEGVVPGDDIKTYANRLENGTSILGDAFVEDTEGINNGYPILAWQEKIKK